MADNQNFPNFLTVADVYDPVETAHKVQELEDAKIRNRINLMKQREMYQQMKKKSPWLMASNNPQGSYNPMTRQYMPQQTQGSPAGVTPTPQAPPSAPVPVPSPNQPVGVSPTSAPQQPQQQQQPQPMSDDERSAIRGQKKLMSVAQRLKPLFAQAKNDPAARAQANQIAKISENDPDQKAYWNKLGYDDVKFSTDEKTGDTDEFLTKKWSKEELEDYAAKAPNGQLFQGLSQHPGKYTLQFRNGAAFGFEMVEEKLGKKTEEELVDIANNDPDPNQRQKALADLNMMQQRKVELYKSQARTKESAKGLSTGIDIPGMADSLYNGQLALSEIRGSMGNPVGTKVISEVKSKYKNFDFVKNEANAKWQTSPMNQKTINQIQGTLPRIGMMVDQVNALPNADIPAINSIMRQVSIQTGKPAYTNFEANKAAIVQEVNTALSGSSTGSDLRVKIELENLTSARSPQQLKGAINNLNEALLSRLDANLSVPYPTEVVQGKKSMNQYRQELEKKYRGRFATELKSEVGDQGEEKSKKTMTYNPDTGAFE